MNALTGAARYSFMYDGNGRLVAVTDGDGNQTIVERNASGEATAIVAPGGQRTDLKVNADGFLASVNNPAGTAVQLGYSGNSAPGLLTSFTDSKSTVHQFTYDADGRLIAECHTPDKAEFEAWLKKSGWTVESLTQIKTVAKTGDVWKC